MISVESGTFFLNKFSSSEKEVPFASGAFRSTFFVSRYDTIHYARFGSRFDPDTQILNWI